MMTLLQSLPAYRRQALLRNGIVTHFLGRRGSIQYSNDDEKKGWGGTQPKEDKMKKLILANRVSKPRGFLNTAKHVFYG